MASSTCTQSKPKTPEVSGFFICTPESIHYLPMATAEDDGNINNSFTDDHSPLGFLPSHPQTQILDSRCGFLLCSSSNKQNDYFLCNPITRQCLSLPPPPIRGDDDEDIVVNAALVFNDSSNAYRVFRFSRGFDILSKRKKDAIPPPPMFSTPDLCVDVYSSQTERWAMSKGSFQMGPQYHISKMPSVIFDGGVCFFYGNGEYGYNVLKFDVEEERSDSISSPPGYFEYLTKCLGACGGRLCYAHHSWSRRRMEVWELDDEKEWVLKHRVEVGYFEHEKFDILAFHPSMPAFLIPWASLLHKTGFLIIRE